MTILNIFSYDFMIRAFIGGVLISIIAPLIGTFLVTKRFSLIADTLSHVALSGVAIGLILNTWPLLTTLIVTVLSALAIEHLRNSKKLPGESVLAMFLPGGLALSVVLLSLSNGFNANLFGFLFGSISTVTLSDIYLMCGLAIVTISLVVLFYRQILFVCVDEEGAIVSGVSTKKINTILVILTAVTVSISMRIVGVLLVGALMVIPSVTAMQIARSFKQVIIFGVIIAAISVVLGLILAFYLSLPAGGVIVLLSLLIFTVVGAIFKVG